MSSRAASTAGDPEVRDFVALVADDDDEEHEDRRSALNIHVEHKGAALDAQHRKSYEAPKNPAECLANPREMR